MHNHEFFRKFLSFLEAFRSFLAVLFWILLIYGFDEPGLATLSIISALIHEMGHVCYLIFFRSGVVPLKGKIFGFSININSLVTYKSNLCLYASGIIFNFIFALLSLPFFGGLSGYAELFCIFNVATAISNLLPVEGYDGYGIIMTVMDYLGKDELFYRIFPKISFGIITLMCFLSLYLMDRLDAGYWIFVIFIFSLLSRIKKTLN